jgi:hypothetical protein
MYNGACYERIEENASSRLKGALCERDVRIPEVLVAQHQPGKLIGASQKGLGRIELAAPL